MVKVKVCGITNLEDARAAIKAGASALGFVFYKKSPRYIPPGEAGKIIKKLPKIIIKIGVFVNSQELGIKKIAQACCLDILQFHGRESPEFCRRFRNYKLIKAFRIKEKLDLDELSKYRPWAYLFDTYSRTKFGGTGQKFNWVLLKNKKMIPRPLFLSGGLSRDNVRQAIKILHPEWVDVSSSVEIRPGEKDHRKIKGFIQMVRKEEGGRI